jgi:hypothetical protein
VEFAYRASSITKDITDGYEEREQRITDSHSTVITVREVANKGTTWSLKHIVGDIYYPEAYDKDDNSTGTCLLG